MFLGFHLNWQHEGSQSFSVSVPLMRWAVLAPPRSLGSAFMDKMSSASWHSLFCNGFVCVCVRARVHERCVCFIDEFWISISFFLSLFPSPPLFHSYSRASVNFHYLIVLCHQCRSALRFSDQRLTLLTVKTEREAILVWDFIQQVRRLRPREVKEPSWYNSANKMAEVGLLLVPGVPFSVLPVLWCPTL